MLLLIIDSFIILPVYHKGSISIRQTTIAFQKREIKNEIVDTPAHSDKDEITLNYKAIQDKFRTTKR